MKLTDKLFSFLKIEKWVEQLPKNSIIISTCNECRYYSKDICRKLNIKVDENFGCIHWEIKKE